jgi:hypothetical protein
MKEHRYILGKTDAYTPGRKNCEAAITWSLTDGKFSMCAEVWLPSKDDIIQGGQCVDSVAALFPDDTKAKRMVAIWERWHLNDMKAGTLAQEAYLRANPVNAIYPESHYTKACEMLAAAGLNPDNGYKYGSQWLKEELPPEVVSEIESWQ